MDQAPTEIPQLSIGHLISWTAFSALGMSIGLVASRTFYTDIPEAYQVYFRCTMIYQAIFFGAAMVGLGVGIASWAKRRPFPSSPGHWILAFLITYVVSHSVAVMASEFWKGQDISWYQMTAYAVGFGFASIMSIFAFFQFRDLGWWRTYFGLYAATSIASTLYYVVFVFNSSTTQFTIMMQVFHWLSMIVMVAAIGYDIARSRRWDWLHWTGAIYSLVGIVFSASSIYIR